MSIRPEWIGDRRVRVGLRIGEHAADVVSIWVVDGPAVQRPSLAGTYVVRVDVSGKAALLQSFGDPRLTRGIATRDEVGHSFGLREPSTVLVDIPLRSRGALPRFSIRVADFSEVRDRPTDPAALSRLFEKPPPNVRYLPSVTLDQLVTHPDWPAVADSVDTSEHETLDRGLVAALAMLARFLTKLLRPRVPR
jgi:hypothetical protein